MMLSVMIILVLVSLLMPALKNSISESKKILCSNQMANMNIGNMLYINDYKGYIPYVVIPMSSYLNALPTSPYDTPNGKYFDMDLLDCPADETRTPEIDYWPYYGERSINISISYNTKLISTNIGNYYMQKQLASFNYPHQNILLFETSRSAGINFHAQIQNPGGVALEWLNEFHHFDGNNFSYLDGSVKFHSFIDYLSTIRFIGDLRNDPNLGHVSVNYL